MAGLEPARLSVGWSLCRCERRKENRPPGAPGGGACVSAGWRPTLAPSPRSRAASTASNRRGHPALRLLCYRVTRWTMSFLPSVITS